MLPTSSDRLKKYILYALPLGVLGAWVLLRIFSGLGLTHAIPVPFVTNERSALAGAITTIGNYGGTDIIDVSFDDEEISHGLTKGAIHFILTPDTDDISTHAKLVHAMTKGKRFYGYEYTTRDAAAEHAKQSERKAAPNVDWLYSELFPGTFFASNWELADPNSNASRFHAQHPDVEFRRLSEVALRRNARYIIVTEDAGLEFKARGVIVPDTEFAEFSSTPWSEATFTIPKTAYNTDEDSGFYAFTGGEMMKLSRNGITSRRIGPAPMGPENYWWYPVEGRQQTVRGELVIYNAGFRPCLDSVGSMHKCLPGEAPASLVAISGIYRWNPDVGGGRWENSTDGSPSSADLGLYPSLLFPPVGMIRVRGTVIERWTAGSWTLLSTLPSAGRAIAHHENVIVVLSADGNHLYRSPDGLLWQTLSVGGVDFEVNSEKFLSQDGRLWIAGRYPGAAHDHILVSPPLASPPDRSLTLSVVSSNTVNLDAWTCDFNTGDGQYQWRLPSESEFRELATSLQALFPSLSARAFRIEPNGLFSFPVMNFNALQPAESSNKDVLLCIADPLSADPVPNSADAGCSVTREPVAGSGGQVYYRPAGARLGVRLDDSCVIDALDRMFYLQGECSGKNCFTRTVSCADDVPVMQTSDCPGRCTDGVCLDPLEDGTRQISGCPLRIGGHPYRTIVNEGRVFIATDGQDAILQSTNGYYAARPISAGWSPYALLIVVPTPAGNDRAIFANQNGINIMDIAAGSVVQTIRGPISPLITLAGSTLFVAYDGQYWTVDTAKELSETLSSTPAWIQGGIVPRPTAMEAVGDKVLVTGRMQQGGVTMSGVSVIDAASKIVSFSSPLTGTPMRIAMTGATAYILTRAADTVTILDTTSNSIIATIPLPGKPTDIAFDGQKALITTYSPQTGSALVTVDTESVTVTNTLVIPPGFSRIKAVAGKAYLIAGTELRQDSYVYVVDTVSNNATTMLRFPEIIHTLETVDDDLVVLFQNYDAAVAGDPLRGQALIIDTQTDTVRETCGG